MTNLGFRLAMERAGIHVVETAVGDRYVLEALEAGGFTMGGEQSGHVVFTDLATTGDGILTGLVLADVVQRSGRTLAELAEEAMTRLPQVLVNVRVAGSAVGRRGVRGAGGGGGRGRARSDRTGAGAAERHRADRAGHGRGGQPRRGRAGRTRSGRRPGGPGSPLASAPMCGIVAILSRPGSRPTPSAEDLLGALDAAVHVSAAAGSPTVTLACMAAEAAVADALLRGVPGVRALADRPSLVAAIEARLDQLDAFVAGEEARVEDADADGLDVERTNAALVRAKDVLWALRRDRLRTAAAVSALAGRDAGEAALAGFLSVQLALSAIDRLEVRGRDSAGLHLFVWDHGLDLDDPELASRLARRSDDPLFPSGAVRVADGVLSFVYKAAAEIGELGDNTAALRAAVRGDGLLHLALATPGARLSVLGHTRWASVGIISEPNTHPVNSEEDRTTGGPYVVAALNGDVDNHADLRARSELSFPAPITTDAKVIPSLVSREALIAPNLVEAFRRTVSTFEGSVAIGAASAAAPGQVLLALRGSGQGLYVGLAEDLTVVASEPYGLVEVTDRYLRMDGETPAHADQPLSGGQVVAVMADGAGELEGVVRVSYDGTPLPVREDELARAEVTTRDIDRGDAPHFLLKEIREAPESFAKTLRGHIVERERLLRAAVGDRALPPAVRDRLADGSIRRVLCIGQGTAAVASQAVAALLDAAVRRPHRRRSDHRHRAVGLPPPALDGRHADHRRQPERAPRPTRTARSTWPAPEVRPSSASSTAARAI